MKLISIFSSHLTPPSPPLPSSLTADDFVTYFIQKVKDISSSFTPATYLLRPSPPLFTPTSSLSPPKRSTE